MYSSQPKNYSLLLTVFGIGLRNGLVSKADVVKWADNIILAEDEPDYFFIEIAVAPDANSILEIIGDHYLQDDPIVGRVLLGLLYVKFKNELIEASKIPLIMDEINYMDVLSGEEGGYLYELSDGFYEKHSIEVFAEWKDDTLQFLSAYENFTLDNIAQWNTLSSTLDARFNAIGEERRQRYELLAKQSKRKARKEAAVIKIALALVVLFALFIVTKTYLSAQNNQYLSKFQQDIYSISIWVILLFVSYQIVRLIYMLLLKMFKI